MKRFKILMILLFSFSACAHDHPLATEYPVARCLNVCVDGFYVYRCLDPAPELEGKKVLDRDGKPTACKKP